MRRALNLLLIEDREDDALLVLRDLHRGGFDVTHTRVETAEAMAEALRSGGWDAIISDFSLPSFSAPAALDVLKASDVDVPFIIVSGTIGEETAVAALKAGAHDFLSKQNLNRLVPALERELREAATRHEHRALEQQLRQSQKMDAVGRLAGGIAHDFNNILTAIQGYATLLLSDLPPDSQHHQDVSEILSAAERASSFTRQLLAFSRNQVTQPEIIELNDMVGGMHNLLNRLIGDEHTLELDLGEPVAVFADRGQLGQVVMNLIVNARDAMEDGGRIRIRTASHEQLASQSTDDAAPAPGEYAVLQVIDEGHGMSSEVADHIFDPFFTTKEAGKGTGLGLSTVYGIVTQHGGTVRVESRPDHGASFTVYLPISAEAPMLRAVEEPREHPTTEVSAIVLVVEDEPAILELVRRTLTRAGYTVITSSTGQQAVTTLEGGQHIDLLLTDLMLPDTTGAELIAAVRQLRPGIRTVLTSGFAATEIAVPTDVVFVEKPFTPDSLTKRLREVLA